MKKLSAEWPLDDLCQTVAELVSLREGPAGVERLLRIIYREGKTTPRILAGETNLPIPVVSAVRRELEQFGYLLREGGIVLAPFARRQLEKLWGPAEVTVSEEDQRCVQPEEFGQLVEVLPVLQEIARNRPPVQVKYDQSFATIATTLKRVELIWQQGWLPGRRILLLGDDDLVSIGIALTLQALGQAHSHSESEIAVVEVDSCLVDFLGITSERHGLKIRVLQHDLKEGLPKGLTEGFDFFFTDPPYTPPGVNLFLECGHAALDPNGTGAAALAIPLAPPELQSATQRALILNGLLIDDLRPAFNHYQGATMHGGTSALYLLSSERSDPKLTETGPDLQTDHIYTREYRWLE